MEVADELRNFNQVLRRPNRPERRHRLGRVERQGLRRERRAVERLQSCNQQPGSLTALPTPYPLQSQQSDAKQYSRTGLRDRQQDRRVHRVRDLGVFAGIRVDRTGLEVLELQQTQNVGTAEDCDSRGPAEIDDLGGAKSVGITVGTAKFSGGVASST